MGNETVYYTQQDMADAIGVSRQLINRWLARDNGKLPPADARTVTGRPLWTEDTVNKLKKTMGGD